MSLFFVAYFRKLFLRKQHGNIYWRILSVIWLFLHLLLQERTLEIRTFLEHFHQWDDGDSKEEERRRHITVTECCVHSLSVYGCLFSAQSAS